VNTQVRWAKGGLGLAPRNNFRSAISKLLQNALVQNKAKICVPMGWVVDISNVTCISKLDFHEYSRSFYIYQEVNYIPGVSRSFQEWQSHTQYITMAHHQNNNHYSKSCNQSILFLYCFYIHLSILDFEFLQ